MQFSSSNEQVFKYHKVTIERLEKFISSIYFTDVNIFGKIYPKEESFDIPKITCFSVPDLKQMDFHEMIDQEFKKNVKIGDSFSPSWSTHWFNLEFTVPKRFEGKEVHISWNCNAEAMLYSIDGTPLQSFTGTNEHFKRHDFILSKEYNESEEKKHVFYVELACNGLFGCGNNGFINAPNPKMNFTLSKAKICVFDRLAYKLYLDMKLIYEIAKNLKESNRPRSLQAMTVGNDIVNTFRENDRETWKKCRNLSKSFFSQSNSEASHLVYACGHSHLDVAWLWPYQESERKAGRTFVTQCLLMDDYEAGDFLFAQSQAVLYDWVKKRYPKIYSRIKEKVREDQWIPVGGTWVEFDGNLPSGESMCRQFLYGQSFFRKEFGKTCEIFWLPDTFGYSAQLPQILQLSGCPYFLTQKLSWNLINKFPHSTFHWEGIDGTRVLSHFPPTDTYCSEFKIEELIKQVDNFKDHDRANRSIMLFGHGDGAGGPKREHCDIYQRIKSGVDGLPKVKMCNPIEFFKDTENDEKMKKRLNVWTGELYFELHRGTYTTQANTKKNNRFCELLLREVEILSCFGLLLSTSMKYPVEILEDCWKKVLINQFHDVLPGSSIEWVYRDADRLYKEVYEGCNQIRDLFFDSFTKKDENKSVVVNTLSWTRDILLEIPRKKDDDDDETEGETTDDLLLKQKTENGGELIRCQIPPMSALLLDHSRKKSVGEIIKKKIQILKNNSEYIIVENEFLRIIIKKKESFRIDMWDSQTGKQVMKNGNSFYLFDDVPLFWDAWDAMIYHLEKKDDVNFNNNDDDDDSTIKIIEHGPLRVRIKFPRFPISKESWIEQVLEMDAISREVRFDTNVEWRENRKFLKVGFPTLIRSESAKYDIQFGHISRPTVKNTSWDYAKCEVSNQKWFDFGEYGMGLSILNDSKYGCAVWKGNEMMLSLLRSPKSPDENCDMGRHHFRYALLPHSRSIQEDLINQSGYEFSVPLIFKNGVSLLTEEKNDKFSRFFELEGDQVVIETIKMSEDGNGIVVRMYETFGGKCTTKLKIKKKEMKKVVLCNILEDIIEEIDTVESDDNTHLELRFSNFEIKSVMFLL